MTDKIVQVAPPNREVYWIITIGILGFAIGASYILHLDVAFFYQQHMPATVAFACGYGLNDPALNIPELRDFLTGVVRQFDCAQWRGDEAFADLHYFEKWHFYLVTAVAVCWLLLGVSYAALWPFYGILVSAFAIALYGFFRLICGRPLAFAAALFNVTSPAALYMLYYPRDYAKAPFVIATIGILLFTMRGGSLRRQILLAVGCGAVMGLGLGFRSDLLILLPLASIIMIFSPCISRHPSVIRRFGPVVTLLLAFGIVGSPILTNIKDGGPLGMVAIEGFSVPFTNYLDLDSSFYDLGHKYSDEQAIATIWAAAAGDRPGFSEYSAVNPESPWRDFPSFQVFLSQLTRFPADALVRVYSTIKGVLNYYDPIGRYFLQAGGGDPAYFGASQLKIPVIDQLHSYILNPLKIISEYNIGIILFVLSVILISSNSLYRGVLFSFIWLYVAAYSSLQFSMRHFFHLEPLFWFSVFASFQFFAQARRGRQSINWKPGSAIVGAIIILGTAGLFGTRLYQSNSLRVDVENLLGAKIQEVAINRVGNENTTLLKLDDSRARVADMKQADWHAPGHPVQIWSARTIRDDIETDMMIVEFGGIGCKTASITISLRYHATPGTWQPFDRNYTVPVRKGDAGTTKLIFPVFYKASQYFTGIEVPTTEVGCVLSLGRFVDPRMSLKPVFMLLPPDWREISPYQTFQDFRSAPEIGKGL